MLAIQSDGRVVVAGWRGTWIGADDTEVVLARYLANTCEVPDVRRQTLAAARRPPPAARSSGAAARRARRAGRSPRESRPGA